MPIRVAINGFGRIGRNALKAGWKNKNIVFVAINDLTDAPTLAHLLKYDSVYHKFDADIKVKGSNITIDGKTVHVLAEKDPSKLPWKELKIDVVLECTGRFTDQEGLMQHIRAGARKAILSAPAKGGNVDTFVMGVNDDKLKKQQIFNNASCTTNCIAPIAQVIQSDFGIKKSFMTTIHGYTADQNLQDGPHKDLRRARAAALNIVPTTTGAAIAAAETIPELKGIFDGLSIRVPVPVGSLSDFTFLLKRKVTVNEVNRALRDAAKSPRLKGILAVTDEPIVSSDIIGNTASSIADLSLTRVVDGDLVKVIAWYDNEWGYSHRLVEMAIRAVK